MAALREKPRICRYELVVPVLFSHLRNADAASERRRWLRSKSSLGSHMLAHACAQLSSESRVVFAWRSKRVTRNEPLFLVSKKRLENPLTPLDPSLCDLWKIHHVPRALPLFFPLLLPFLVLVSSTRLFGFLLVAFAFCSRWEGIEFYGRVEWYIRGIRQEELAYVIVFSYPLWGKYRLQKDLLFRR